MAILREHIPFYRDIFKIPGIFSDPFLMLGYQDIAEEARLVASDLNFSDLKQYLHHRGLNEVDVVDLFDPRASLPYDLNVPVPVEAHERYQTVLDIGTLEHLLDTRQCLENCMRMVRVGGMYFLLTPVNGFLYHGLHTFNPELITESFRANRFEILYQKFSSNDGRVVRRADDAADTLLWIVGKKTQSMTSFKIHQQAVWEEIYTPKRNHLPASGSLRMIIIWGKVKAALKWFLPPIFILIYSQIQSRIRLAFQKR